MFGNFPTFESCIDYIKRYPKSQRHKYACLDRIRSGAFSYRQTQALYKILNQKYGYYKQYNRGSFSGSKSYGSYNSYGKQSYGYKRNYSRRSRY